MSRWKQYQIKKQQKRKLKKKAEKTRQKVLALLLEDKLDEAEETAKTFLFKHPKDVRAWRMVRGVEAWRGFWAKVKGMRKAERERIKAEASKVWFEEVKHNDKLTVEGLKKRLLELLPTEEEG